MERGEERSAHDRVAVSGLRHARAGLDVPIESKLHAPGPRKEWVERPALIEYLAASTARLVLVDAPAGFGKTTLVAQWRSAAGDERPFAWVSLGPGDDDPGRLWRYIKSALQRRAPASAARTSPASSGPQPRTSPVRCYRCWPTSWGRWRRGLSWYWTTTTSSRNAAAMTRSRSCSCTCRRRLRSCSNHAGRSAVAAGARRARPPRWSRSWAREFRFTAEEAGAAPVHDVSRQTHWATPTWPTWWNGPRAGRPDCTWRRFPFAAIPRRVPSSVSAFTGDNRFVVDFLADEVLGRQPGEVQQFLARTAVLSQLCARAVRPCAVTGTANAAAIIEVLERERPVPGPAG